MKAHRGFTLIELLVVVSIIGMLSSVVLASLNSARTKAQDAERLSDMRTMVTALELYASSNGGRYPNTGAGSWVHSASSGAWIPGLTSAYIANIPRDPRNVWGNPEFMYYYNSDGKDYCIQISQANTCTNNPYYWGVWAGTCKLRTGTSNWCSLY